MSKRRKPIVTRSRNDLARLVREGKATGAGIATTLEIAQPSVWAWIKGYARPEPHHRAALKRFYSIDPDGWMTAAEYASAFGHNRSNTGS